MELTDSAFLEVLIYVLFAAIWLGPFLVSALRGKVRLIHPNCCVPVPVVYLTSIALYSRMQGEIMLNDSSAYSWDSWFLAAPMLFMTIMGIFYHAGVYLSGLSPLTTSRDSVSRIVQLRSLRRIPTPGIVMLVSVVGGLLILARLMGLRESETGQGIWMFNALARGFLFLPLFLVRESGLWGAVFAVLAFLMGLSFVSKAALVFYALVFLLFYQQRILKVSKSSVLVVLGISLIPLCVSLYRMSHGGSNEGSALAILMGNEPIEAATWDDAGQTLRKREYAFEAFAIVFQHYGDGNPLRLGKETVTELSHIIPYYLWPDKPTERDQTAFEFLPFEVSQCGGHLPGMTMYFLTPILLDWGFGGCAVFMVSFGLFLGYAYKRSWDTSLSRGENWPMKVDSVLPFVSHFFIRRHKRLYYYCDSGRMQSCDGHSPLTRVFESPRWHRSQRGPTVTKINNLRYEGVI